MYPPGVSDGCSWLPDPDIESVHRFPWSCSRFAFSNDRAEIEELRREARSLDGVLITGMSLGQIESLLALRGLQLLRHEPRLDIPSVILLAPGSAPFRRLGDRMRSGWPFRSALFVADAETVATLRAEGLAALDAKEAAGCRLRDLLDCREGVFEDMLADQVLAVQLQPAWLYSGSTVVFGNQTDAMLDLGWFVLRVIMDPDYSPGPTLRRRMMAFVTEGNSDATAHIDTLACSAGTPMPVDEPIADASQAEQIRLMKTLAIPDDLATELMARAEVVIVNYVLNFGFALRAAPAAKYVLETHDDITCMQLIRSRVIPNAPVFPDLGSVKRHLALERLAWKAADVCIALSLSDFRKISRHAAHPVFVLPRPYARVARIAGADATWDILVVMHPHPLNIIALDHFLRDVIASDPALSRLRIAIAGRVKEVLEADWKERLPATRWLGYVADIDALRDSSRLSVCPDAHGTGIAIKALTTIAARHPMVATRTALRGLPDDILRLIPPADCAAGLQDQIRSLLSEDDLLTQRRDAVGATADRLWPAASHVPALGMAMQAGPDKTQLRAQFLAALGEDRERPPLDIENQRIRFGSGGNDRSFLGRNWLQGEQGGRWSDGNSATIHVPRAWLTRGGRIDVTFMETVHCRDVALAQAGKPLDGSRLAPGVMSFRCGRIPECGPDRVELALSCREAFCPQEDGLSDDNRVLGMHVKTIEIVPAPFAGVLSAALSALGLRTQALARRLAARRRADGTMDGARTRTADVAATARDRPRSSPPSDRCR